MIKICDESLIKDLSFYFKDLFTCSQKSAIKISKIVAPYPDYQ